MAITLLIVSIIGLFAFAMYKNKKDPNTDKVSSGEVQEEKKNATHIQTENNAYTENLVAKIFFVIGFLLFAVGFFGGVIVANDFHHFSTFLFFTWTISGFIIGMIFIGFGEVIRLLQAQFDKSIERNEYMEKISNNEKSS